MKKNIIRYPLLIVNNPVHFKRAGLKFRLLPGKYNLIIGAFAFYLLTLVTLSGYGQSNKSYHERSLEIQHEMWSDTSAAFRQTQIPPGMIKESGVILATSFDLIDDSKFVFKLGGPAQKLNFRTSDHIRLKLNDRAAVERYSILDYDKNQNKSHFRTYDMFRNISETYIGVKIIKPDGTERIINTDDEVLRKNSKETGQLLISGLAEGDILDYYIQMEEVLDVEYASGPQGPYTFLLGDEYCPILYQKIRFRFGAYFRPQYISANGAPALVMHKDGEDNPILELELNNISKWPDTHWVSELRQIPYIKFQMAFIKRGDSPPGQFRGEVVPGILYNDFVKEIDEYLQNPKSYYDNRALKITRDNFGGNEKIKLVTQDSVVKFLYNAWYYNAINSNLKDTATLLSRIKYARPAKLSGALEMSKMLSALGINNSVYLVCSRNAASFKNVMNLQDMDALLKVSVDSGRVYWMAFDDVLTLLNEIPDRFQDEFAIAIKSGITSGSREQHIEKDKIPLSTASDNTITDSIQVNFDSSSPTTLRIEQTSQVTGSVRHYIQNDLMLFEDIESALAASVSKESITNRLNSEKKKKEFQYAFEQERTNQKTNFENAIKERFGSKPEQLISYEVIRPDLCRKENAFNYKTIFLMRNWVNNEHGLYQFQAGKLLGVYQDIANKDHKRTLNVYLPSARTVNFQISIHIPDGYRIKDASFLNISVSNETGSCRSIATVTDKTLEWWVSEMFTSNFEPVAAWPKLAEILNAMYILSGKEIAFEKINP
jgi:hypothetical protein